MFYTKIILLNTRECSMKNTLKANFAPVGIHHDRNNCYISAVATSMNISYVKALMLCLEAGWDDGMYHHKAIEMAQEQGWEVVGCKWNDWQLLINMPGDTVVLPQCTIAKLVKLLKAQFHDKTFIVFTDDHAFCVKNGNVYDHGQTAANKRAVMFFVVNNSQSIDEEMFDVYDEFYCED